MKSLLRFTLSICVALAATNVFAISGAFDAGGGASIPLPPGMWVVHSDERAADYGKSGQAVVLGLAPGQTGDVVGILVKYTRNSESWRSDPSCYARLGDSLINFYGTTASAFINKCSRVLGSGEPISIFNILSRWEVRKNKWAKNFLEGAKKIKNAKVVQIEIELRQFNGRNVRMFMWVKPPTKFQDAEYTGVLVKSPVSDWLGNWIELYTESLQAAFQFRKTPPRIMALGFGTAANVANVVNSGVSQTDSYDLLMESARQGDPNREDLTADVTVMLPTLGAGDGKNPVQISSATTASIVAPQLKSFDALLDRARAGDINREDLTADVAIVLPFPGPDAGVNDLQNMASLESTQQGQRNEGKVPVEEQVERDALERQRLAIEAQAKKQLAAQQQLEQERLALAKQKDSISAELAAMRQMLAELKKANEDSARAEKQAVAEPAIKEPAKPVVMARRRALVIGNDNYKNVSKLDNAVEDAKAMSEALEGLGYKVDLHANLTERAFKRALRNFRADLKGGEEVLFFYAGHGVQLGNSNYLLPVDLGSDSADQVRDESIELQRVLDDIAEQKTKFALAVIDACRDNPFKQTGRAIGGRGLAPTTAATGQMVMFSAGAGQQALDKLGQTDSSPNGLFTRVFLDEMKKPGIPVDRVLRNVRQRVVTLARSVGHEQVPALYDQAIGEFYFKPK
jgi:hypothetical protein